MSNTISKKLNLKQLNNKLSFVQDYFFFFYWGFFYWSAGLLKLQKYGETDKCQVAVSF